MTRLNTARGRRRWVVPNPRWVMVFAVFAMFASVLLTNGLISSQVGIDAAGAALDGPDAGIPSQISDGGPVIDLTKGRVDSLRMPPRTVALSFDDGPDPEWTPQVLGVLSKYHVPGTFFTIGSRVAHYPDLVREIAASGSEIGLHTFTHPDLRDVTPTRVDQEFTGTQLALAGATGKMSYLIRPPYSSEADAVDDAGYRVMQQLGGEGYATALVDIDSNDWQRPGVATIVNNVMPAAATGGVVLLHDSGGDRSETVAALDQLIPKMQAQGVTFTTITGGVGLPPADFAADTSHLLMGKIMLGAVGIAAAIVDALEWSLLLGGGLVLLRLLLMIVVARRTQRRHPHAHGGGVGGADGGVTDPVSVIVPAYNENATIEATVRSLVASDHPVEIIVVDDGSTDGTADTVEALGLPAVQVIRTPNGGKSAALNVGIAAASHELLVMIDGDTILEPTTVRHLVAPLAAPQVGAVAGNVRVADRGSLIACWQHIEYVIGFNIDRRVQAAWGVITTVPGAAGAFRRAALVEVGGVSDDTLAEDTDLTIALGRAGWQVAYQPDARVWTDAPATFEALWRQRYRWSYGTMQSLWKHRHTMLERGPSGHLGRTGLLITGLFQIALPLLAPMVDVYLVYGLIFLNPATTAAIWAAATALQLTAGVVAFRLEREPLKWLVLLPLQQIVYRQLMYAVLIQSVASALAGTRLRWHKIPRSGQFSAAPSSAKTAAPLPAGPSSVAAAPTPGEWS